MLFIIIILYVIGVLIYIDHFKVVKVMQNKFEIFYTRTEITIKDACLGLIWPIVLILYFIKLLIFFLNEIILSISILLGLRYINTKIYNRIEKWWV